MTSFIDDNGNALDYSGADLVNTKQVASFYDFKLKGNYSVDFKIPNTAKNRDTLGYYGAQQITSPAFSQQPFNLVFNGNNMAKGYLIIKGSDDFNIDCFFVSGNSNWFDLLQFNVRDIIFSPRFVVSWDAMDTQKAATEGIVFPIVDWCYGGYHRAGAFNLMNRHGNPGPNDSIQEVFPCLYMHTLVDQMANHAQVNITGDLLDDPIFNRVIITPDGPDMTVSDALIKKTKATVGMSADEVTPATYPFDTIFDIGELALFDLTNRQYRCPMKGVYKVVVDYTATATPINISVTQYRGGLSVSTLQWYAAAGQTSGNMVFNFACEAGDLLETKGIGGGLLSRTTTVVYSLEDTSKPYYIYNNGAGTYVVACTGLVLPNSICPDLTGVDLIKTLCVMFGAYCTYDETAKTLSINKISKLKREDAKNWSKYYVSHYENYQTGAATHNFIKYEDTPEVGLLPYNQDNVAGFGGWDLQTSFDQVAYRQAFKIPFAGSWDEHPKNVSGWFMPYIKFYDLKDDFSTTWNFSAVNNSGGFVDFYSVTGDQPFLAGDLVKITGSFYTGYGIISSATTTDVLISAMPYIATTSGIMTKVNFSPVQTTNRLLLAYPGATVADADGPATFYFYYGVSLASSAASSTACLAWFDKPKMSMTIDKLKDSLAFDTISNRDYNNTLAEKYHQFIENIYNNPTVKAKLRLPAGAFQSFDFTSFVYLKTKKLTGYFFVSKIEWKDPQTECNVELLYLD